MLYSFTFPMILRLPLAAVAFTMAGYIFWRDFIQEKGPDPAIVDPVYYADGSGEYTLFDRPGPDSKVEREAGSWVLRFSDLINCQQTLPNGQCGEYKEKRLLPNFFKGPASAVMSLRFDITDFSIAKEHEWDYRPNILRISLTGRYKSLFRGIPGHSREFGFGRLGWDDCMPLKEIAPNFYQLRHATDAEKAAAFKGKNYSKRINCGRVSKERNTYRLVNAEGRQIARGVCSKKARTEDRKVVSCSFSAWIPQERMITLNFDRGFIHNFPEIYNKTVQLLSDATVLEKSTSIKWRP